MSRAAFVSWLKKKANPVGLAAQSGGLLGLLTGGGLALGGSEAEGEWKCACGVDEVARTRVCLCFSGKIPIYVVANGEVTAYRAFCPADNALINWSVSSGRFRCTLCGRLYGLDGKEIGGTKAVKQWPCRVEGGKVYLIHR